MVLEHDCKNCPAMEAMVQNLKLRIEKIECAFPNGDYEGHKGAHEALIEDVQVRKEQNRIRREFVSEIIKKTISGIIWSAIVATGVLLWKGIVSHIKGL